MTVSVADRVPAGVKAGGVKVMLKKQDVPTAIDVPVPPLINPQVGDPLVGACRVKSPGFAPVLVAELPFSVSVAPPLLVNWTFTTVVLVVPASVPGNEARVGLNVISGVVFATIGKLLLRN